MTETMPDIWKELNAKVRGFVGKRVGDPSAADDITQDVMLKVQTHVGSLPPENKLPAWLFAVARNAVIDHYRSRAVRADHAAVADVEQFGDETEVDRREAIERLTPCLIRMIELVPEPYREALKLIDFEGLGQQELADRAGISLSGAKSRVQRGRLQLKEMIEDCCMVERDARGNVMEFETTEKSARYCGEERGKPRCDA